MNVVKKKLQKIHKERRRFKSNTVHIKGKYFFFLNQVAFISNGFYSTKYGGKFMGGGENL